MGVKMNGSQSKLSMAAAALLAFMAFAPNQAKAQAMVTPPGGGFNPIPVWAVMGCSADIIFAGFVASLRDNRELTATEAWFCGIPFWFEQPVERKKKKKKHRH
jgi:hypothetical protein